MNTQTEKDDKKNTPRPQRKIPKRLAAEIAEADRRERAEIEARSGTIKDITLASALTLGDILGQDGVKRLVAAGKAREMAPEHVVWRVVLTAINAMESSMFIDAPGAPRRFAVDVADAVFTTALKAAYAHPSASKRNSALDGLRNLIAWHPAYFTEFNLLSTVVDAEYQIASCDAVRGAEETKGFINGAMEALD